MNPITLYDATGVVWTSNISPDINPVESDQYLVSNAKDGSLVSLNVASKEGAGGLISTVLNLPAGAQYFGLDVDWIENTDDNPHKAANEMDLKITLVSATTAPIPNQANGSLQWNASAKQWQLDPTGTGWVNTGFTQAPIIGKNTMQSRFWSNGTKWSCTGLRLNGGAIFTPSASFTNLPMIITNWIACLIPQLQTECQNVPWYLRSLYTRVWVLAGTSPIAMQ